MATDYPDDADGNALRRVAAGGSNMSKPMDIDFQIAAPDEATAKRVAAVAIELGYRIRVYGGAYAPWKCQITKSMIPTYDSLITAQAELDAIARPLGAYVDGWGTYGRGKQYTMRGSQSESQPIRRPFQYSLRSLLLATTLLGTAFGLFRVVFSTGFPLATRFFALLGGLLLCGGVTGAAVGHTFNTQQGSMAERGAMIGAIVFVVVPLLLCAVYAAWLFLILTTMDFRVAG